jgi:4-aminobutyrate aminotransferase / (S)-3-amino-2-methylpropionate transaminase / 5-aminovalerate transaminase
MVQTYDQRTSTTARSDEIWAERERWVPRGVSTYAHVVVERAHGAEVWDVDGKRYVDFAGGIGTLNVGHTPEEVVEALQEQARDLIHMCFSVAIYEPYVEVARRLAQITPGDFPKKTMLVNSGAEAIENAIKIARVATGRPNIIAFENAFHGRTLMGMTLTGKDRPYKEGFGPFAPGVYHAASPYAYRCSDPECAHNIGGDAPCSVAAGDDVERLLATEIAPDTVAAIVIEPVQGEGGFLVAPPSLLRRLRDICDREGIVLIADEVQTGFGRTGRMFAVEHAGVVPDLVVLAKSLAAGMPLGAVVGRAEIMDAPGPGGIGGTFGGNPLACRAALAVLDLFARDNVPARAADIGETIFRRFGAMQQRYDLVGDVRGLGAMVAMELVRDRATKEPATEETAEIIHRCHDAGLIIIKAGLYDNVIRVLAPLTISDALLVEGLDTLERELAEVANTA